jgi:hypothetical protein
MIDKRGNDIGEEDEASFFFLSFLHHKKAPGIAEGQSP